MNNIYRSLFCNMQPITAHHTTILRPFFRNHPGKAVPEENFCTLWCKGRLTEADTDHPAPSRSTSAHLHHPLIFYRPDVLPAAQPTVSKHWRTNMQPIMLLKMTFWFPKVQWLQPTGEVDKSMTCMQNFETQCIRNCNIRSQCKVTGWECMAAASLLLWYKAYQLT